MGQGEAAKRLAGEAKEKEAKGKTEGRKKGRKKKTQGSSCSLAAEGKLIRCIFWTAYLLQLFSLLLL